MLQVIMIVITLTLIFCCILSFKNKKNDSIQQVLMLIVTAVIGAGTIFFSVAPQNTVKVIIPEITEVVENNSKLKTENKTLQEELTSTANEREQLKKSINNNAAFSENQLYVNDAEISINNAQAIAKINNKLYFSSDVLESIIGENVHEDRDNKIVYFGKYPEELIDFLSVCEPYDIGEGFDLGSKNAFKIQSKNYSQGIKLKAYYDKARSAKFNLGKKYSELSFNIGHIDETELKNTFTLNIYVDEKIVKEIQCNSDVNIDEIQSVPINNGKILKFEWLCDAIEGNYGASYGLINLKLK